MLKFIEKMLDRVLLWISLSKRVNNNARCPACGHRKGAIRYDPATQKLLHGCQNCSAIWPENPRIKAVAWDFVGRDLKSNADAGHNVRELFDKANAPVRGESAHVN